MFKGRQSGRAKKSTRTKIGNKQKGRRGDTHHETRRGGKPAKGKWERPMPGPANEQLAAPPMLGVGKKRRKKSPQKTEEGPEKSRGGKLVTGYFSRNFRGTNVRRKWWTVQTQSGEEG